MLRASPLAALPFGVILGHFFSQSRPLALPLPQQSQKVTKKMCRGCSIQFFFDFFSKEGAPRSRPLGKCFEKALCFSMFSLISPSRPSGAKWDPKVSQMGALGAQSGLKW